MNYYEHHIGDYAAATAHLSLLEDAVYSRLLRRYYMQEEPLPPEVPKVARLVGARTPDEIDAVAVVLEEFFALEADGWHNKRADEEIERYRAKIDAARENGKKGGRPPKKPKETQPFPPGYENETQHKPHQTPDTNIGIASQSKGGAKAPALPPWLDPTVWADWHAFRNSRKGWTARARELSLRKLTQLHAEGHAPRAVIEQSIERGWTGLFAPHEDRAHATDRRLSAVERVRANVEAAERRDAGCAAGHYPAAHALAADG